MNRRSYTLLLVLAAVLLLITACVRKDSPDTLNTSAPTLPPCAQAGPAVSLPSEFPTNFPLPPGTMITSSQRSQKGVLVVSGFIPMEFKNTVAFFQSKLPAAGYQLLKGDAEMDEAESTFSGQGFQGKWKVQGILNCSGAVTLTIAVWKS
jgi:hypothetical protein